MIWRICVGFMFSLEIYQKILTNCKFLSGFRYEIFKINIKLDIYKITMIYIKC